METSKIYLDTSVPSAYFDLSKPVRQLVTEKWFDFESRNYTLFTSSVTIEELLRWENIVKREKVLELLTKFSVEILPISDLIIALARKYISAGAIPESELEDSLHIAAASLNNIENLVSWNFKHIVSENPIRKIREINRKEKLLDIEIATVELFGGYKYGNL